MSPALRDMIEADGGAIPLPDVDPGLRWVWDAWHRLSADRPWKAGGMGPAFPGNIAWASVVGWCDFHGHTGEDVAFMDLCFRAMDEVFFEDHIRRVNEAGKR